MQVTQKKLSDTKVQLTITLGLEELTHAKQHELSEQAKTMKVAGFRQGKAPLSVVEKKMDEQQLQASIINHAINDTYKDAVDQKNIRPLAQPQVTVGKFVPYTELEYIAETEIMPPIKLGDYKKIKKTIPKTTITAKEVDDVIDNLLLKSAEKKDSTKPAKLGDEVIVNFEGKDANGKAVAGASGKDYPLSLGSKTFIPGFEEGLVGLKPGEKKELKLTFPKDYHAKNLASSKITFNIEVVSVKTVEKPKLDDKFATSVGPFKTVDELKKDVKQQLTEQRETENINKVKDEIVEELVKKSTLTLPDILINDQVAMLEQDFNQNLIYRGITKQEYIKQEGYKDEEDWKKKELKPQAERRVSVGMVLSEVSEAEKLTVTEAELAERINLYKQQYQQNATQFDQPEMQREVISRILTEKTVNRLFELATSKKN